MTFIRDSLREYREFYIPLRPQLADRDRGPLRLMLLGMLFLCLFSLMLHCGWFLPALERPMAARYLHFGEAAWRLIPLLGFISWIGLALARLRSAGSQPPATRFLLALHSGVWPVISALLLTALTLLLLLLLSDSSLSHSWLGIHESWKYMLQHLRHSLWLELATLPSHLLHFSALTTVGLAVACLNRSPAVAWLVCGLLDMQLLIDIAGCFQDPNIYALYWMDSFYRPGLLLLGYTALVYLMLHIADNDRSFLAVAAVIVALRMADLMFSFSRYGSFTAVQYDDVMKPLANLVWHLNIPFRFPLVGCQPADYNPAFGFSASFGEGQLLGVFDQFQSGLYLGWAGYPLAWAGNLLVLGLVAAACLHSVARHSRMVQPA